MKAILAAGAAMLAMAAPAAGQKRTVHRTVQGTPQVTYGSVPSTVVVTTSNWQAPPPPVYQQPYQEVYEPRVPYAPIPVDAEVFSGFRAEATVAFDRLRDEADGFVFFGDGSGRNGVSYGGEVGFDAALGTSLLVGGYVGAEGSTIRQCDTFIGFEQCFRAGRSFTAGGRLGYALSPFAMIYAKGGYTNARITTEEQVVAPGAPFNRFRDDLDGFHVGGGIEAAFGRNAYGKLEYVYTRLRDLPVGTADGAPLTIDLNRHQVRAGIGLRL